MLLPAELAEINDFATGGFYRSTAITPAPPHPDEPITQPIPSVLLRPQLPTAWHSGAALGGLEYGGAISIALYEKSGKIFGRLAWI
jgi:hypothetical protein